MSVYRGPTARRVTVNFARNREIITDFEERKATPMNSNLHSIIADMLESLKRRDAPPASGLCGRSASQADKKASKAKMKKMIVALIVAALTDDPPSFDYNLSDGDPVA